MLIRQAEEKKLFYSRDIFCRSFEHRSHSVCSRSFFYVEVLFFVWPRIRASDGFLGFPSIDDSIISRMCYIYQQKVYGSVWEVRFNDIDCSRFLPCLIFGDPFSPNVPDLNQISEPQKMFRAAPTLRPTVSEKCDLFKQILKCFLAWINCTNSCS